VSSEVSADQFFIGQTGYYPVTFVAKNSNCPDTVETDIGRIGYKYYAFVVTNKMEDGAQAMVMGSAMQKGTTSKPQSVHDRSAYVIREGSRPKFNNSH
jgi:hypothetical protein